MIMANKTKKVILIKILIGRATARINPLNEDQPTKILSIENSKNEFGVMLEIIPAYKKFGVYYKRISLPDGKEIEGDIMFIKNFEEFEDTPDISIGINKLIEKMNNDNTKLLFNMQKSKNKIERFLSNMKF